MQSDEEVESSSDSSVSSDSEVSSLGSLEDDLKAMRSMIGEMYKEAEKLELHLYTLQRPMLDLEMNQLGTVPFLESSPFRHQTFQMKPPGIPGIPNKRYPFHVICKYLREYLAKHDAIQADGTITLTDDLKSLFGIQESSTTYMALLGHLRNVLD
jgi:hypothetical protein